VSLGQPESPHPGGVYSHTTFVCEKEQQNGIFLQGASEVTFPLFSELCIPETSI
jgi:hypothetical protein